MDYEEIERGEDSKIKFFIKEQESKYYYYAYYYEEDEYGNMYLLKDGTEKYIKQIGQVGDIILNYFNTDFNSLYDYFRNILEITPQQIMEMQNEMGILFRNLIFKEYNNGVGRYISCFPESMYEDAKEISDRINVNFDKNKFAYLLRSFEKNQKELYRGIEVLDERCKNFLQYMSDVRDMIKLKYESIKGKNETNLFNLSLYYNTSKITYEILPDENNCPLEVYSINDILTFLLFDMVQVDKYKIQINVCENCGKYFYPISKVTEKYCDNPFSKNGRTCKELSSEIKASKDEITKLYRNAYKAQNGRKQRHIKNTPNVNIELAEKIFKKWCINISSQKMKCESGEITIDEFMRWIKDNSQISFISRRYLES